MFALKRNRVTDADIAQMKQDVSDLAKRAEELEQATLNGEEEWMITVKGKSDPIGLEQADECV